MAFRDTWERFVDERRKAGDDTFEPGTVIEPKSRSRINDFSFLSSGTYTFSASGGGGPTVHDDYVLNNVVIPGYGGAIAGEKKVMTDFVTPNFRRLQRQGVITNTSMRSVHDVWIRNDGYCEWNAPYGPATTGIARSYCQGAWANWFTDPGSTWGWLHKGLVDKNNCIQVATIDALQKVRKPDTMALVTAYEMQKTIDLVANSVKKVRMLLQLAKSPSASFQKAIDILGHRFKRPTPPKTKLKDVVQSNWLEYRYGWGPLLYDIKGMLEATFVSRYKTFPRNTARGFGSLSKTEIAIENLTGILSNPLFGSPTVLLTCKDEFSARAYAMYDFDVNLRSLTDFGIFAIPETLWEIMPYSFVLDWIAPIGDYVSALTPKLGVNMRATGVSTTQIITSTRRILSWADNPSSPWVLVSSPINVTPDKWITTTKERLPILKLDAYPPVNVKLNLKRCIDAFDLLSQVLR